MSKKCEDLKKGQKVTFARNAAVFLKKVQKKCKKSAKNDQKKCQKTVKKKLKFSTFFLNKPRRKGVFRTFHFFVFRSVFRTLKKSAKKVMV